MEEAKARIKVIDAAIGRRLALPDMIMEEFTCSFGCCANSQRLIRQDGAVGVDGVFFHMANVIGDFEPQRVTAWNSRYRNANVSRETMRLFSVKLLDQALRKSVTYLP